MGLGIIPGHLRVSRQPGQVAWPESEFLVNASQRATRTAESCFSQKHVIAGKGLHARRPGVSHY
jgi:hypothetical protein